MREGHSGLALSPWLPGIERSQAGPEFARCRRSSRTPERRESRGRIGKGRSRQASQAHPRRLSATVANSDLSTDAESQELTEDIVVERIARDLRSKEKASPDL